MINTSQFDSVYRQVLNRLCSHIDRGHYSTEICLFLLSYDNGFLRVFECSDALDFKGVRGRTTFFRQPHENHRLSESLYLIKQAEIITHGLLNLPILYP